MSSLSNMTCNLKSFTTTSNPHDESFSVGLEASFSLQFLVPTQGPSWMVITPPANTSDFLCQIRRYRFKFASIVNSYFSIHYTFFVKFHSPADIRELLPTPKETYDLNVRAIFSSSIWSFRTPSKNGLGTMV